MMARTSPASTRYAVGLLETDPAGVWPWRAQTSNQHRRRSRTSPDRVGLAQHDGWPVLLGTDRLRERGSRAQDQQVALLSRGWAAPVRRPAALKEGEV